MPEAVEERPGAAEAVTYLEAISRALREEMRRDPSVYLMGQDIAEYGGAFKVTKGFLEEFGEGRVINTPISESGTVGMAVGSALLGRRPVVEMQFADFISCAFNQVVNVAAKMHWRTGRPVPLVIRCPAGGGGGAGAFHSQSMEAWFLHAPGLKVVMPAWPSDAYGLLKAAIRDPDPVLFFEHKYLYRRVKERLPGAAEGGDGLVPIGSARVVREGAHLSILSYGWMVHRALEAAGTAAAEGISTEVVDLRSLVPLDEETLLASARKTGKVLIVHEAPLTGGAGAELAARIAEKAFEHLDAPVRRMAYPDAPVPYNKALEAACLPRPDTILEAIRELRTW
jgi:2-oxoisovalerate dehydrogenase E1 component beta subunit